MRVTPIALPRDLRLEDRTGAAQLQAAMTHAHPTALAASELTMLAVLWAIEETPLIDLPARLRERAEDQRAIYRDDWLGDLWKRTQEPAPSQWIARGWDDCLQVLDRLDTALKHPDRVADPCLATGAGWVAEEALATALYCVLLFPDDPVAALSRAAVTSGDSDSIAALAGSIIGAAHGMSGWPEAWSGRIEYAGDLARFAAAWS
jgi:ADP-ribosylglycohydrolase